MNVLKKVILKDLKLNKKRTIVTIIGIILSTALICAVAGMVTSVQKTLVEYTKEKNGNYHVSFNNVPKEEVKYIENNVNIDKHYLSENLGYSKLNESENEYKPYLHIVSANNEYLNNMGIRLTQGRLPENDNEIIISEHIIDNGGINYKVGDEITLDVCKRASKWGELLYQNTSYDKESEKLEKKYTKKYIIVGIMERLSYAVEPYEAPGYTVITKMDNIQEKANVSVLYKNVYQYKKYTNEINNNKNYDTSLNTNLLDYEGVGLSETSITTICQLALIIIVIIIVSSVFVIRNAFAISTTERMKQYGMLASVGATSKQIKKSVLFEGFILGIIAIPLGILAGMLAVVILLWLVNIILADSLNGIKLIYCIPWLPIILSVLLSSITIYLSAISSARKAAKISPVELIRSNQDIKIKAKKIRTPKFISKIFGIGGDISYKNLKRNRKKYRTTIISIIVSVVIFISLSSFIEYGFDVADIYYKEKSYNIQLYLHYNKEPKTLEEKMSVYNQISKLDNVEDFSIHNSNIAYLLNKDNFTNSYSEYLTSYDDDENLQIEIISIGNEAYEKYVKELGGSVKNYSKGGILINNYLIYDEDNKPKVGDIYKLKEGDFFGGKIDDKNINIPIVKITDKKPMGLENTYSETGFLIVSDDFLKDNIGSEGISRMYIQSSDAYKLEDDINNLINNMNSNSFTLNIYNLDAEAKAQNSMVLVISIFLYGFITVITLIGITNIFNTMTTTMNLRRKEFAMLKSVGMTQKEFNRMIRLESIFYGLKALIIGIPIGICISYLIYRAFLNSLETIYRLPLTAIIISVVFVFAVVGIIMKFSLNKINKQNIIDTIREDNI